MTAPRRPQHFPAILPQRPVDRFVLDWWETAESSHPAGPVVHRKAIYHANRSHGELFPDQARTGMDWVDEWQMCQDGQTTGRNVGWNDPLRWTWDHAYATKEEAEAARQADIEEAINRHRNAISDLEAMRASPSRTPAPREEET